LSSLSTSCISSRVSVDIITLRVAAGVAMCAMAWICSCACCVGYPSRCQFCVVPRPSLFGLFRFWMRSLKRRRFCWKLFHVRLSSLCGQFRHRWWQLSAYSGRPSHPKHFIGAFIPLDFWSASSTMLTMVSA
jgi:hypothetical protein